MLKESKCSAVLEVDVRDPIALARSLEPDNRGAPRGLIVECRGGERLECIVEIQCTAPGRVLTLRNTIDDLLQSIQAAESALKSAGDG